MLAQQMPKHATEAVDNNTPMSNNSFGKGFKTDVDFAGANRETGVKAILSSVGWNVVRWSKILRCFTPMRCVSHDEVKVIIVHRWTQMNDLSDDYNTILLT